MSLSEVRPLPGTGAEPAEPRAAAAPAEFVTAVASLQAAPIRPEIRVEAVRPPQRLAPWSYALAADVTSPGGGETATGRLVLLHDPDGNEAWHGTLRLVAFVTAELDDAMVVDPLLPSVGWSWLLEALAERSADFTAAGGTVTHTMSTRFGDLAGPSSTASIELRASWTASTSDLQTHLLAFLDVLTAAAGLPPEGVTLLSPL